MMASLIVVGAIVFGAVLLVAWLVSPDVRAWLEKPKYRFQQYVQRYDRAVGGGR